jgi:type IV pilus assembly protein PilC
MAIELTKIRQIQRIISEKPEKASSLKNLLQRDIKLFGSKLNDKKKERFYTQLSILIEAGVNMKTALDMMLEEYKKEELEIITHLRNEVVNGSSLSEAIGKTGKFSEYERFSIKIGEESGTLVQILQEQAAFFTRSIKQRSQVINAISYPLFVLITAMGTVLFMMNYIVPMFSNFFKRFQGGLPWVTKAVIKASALVNAYSLYVILILLVVIVFLFSQRKKEWFRKYSAWALLHIPIMRGLVKKIYIARFCSSMNLLLSSKTPLVYSLELVKNMVGFYPLEVSLKEIKEKVEKGSSLSQGLGAYPIYDRQLVSLVKVAEETNRVDLIFNKLSRQYNEEVSQQTELLGSLLQPILLVFVGTFVAIILIAMYLPMFKLGSIMH